MTTQAFFIRPGVILRLHEGPLAPYVDIYASQLFDQGFSHSKARHNIRLFADFSRWLQRMRIDPKNLDESTLDRYRKYRERTRPLVGGDRLALHNFLKLFREIGVSPPPKAIKPGLCDLIGEEFRSYLHQEIGLSDKTLELYSEIIRAFIQNKMHSSSPEWSSLTGAYILKFSQKLAKRHSPQYMQRFRTALRSFLRFLHYSGKIPSDLSASIPSVAKVQLATIPKFLTESQVQKVISCCDRNTKIGKRDYVILLLLSRLGLRAMEVATLSLDDIDWQSGLFTFYAKGNERVSMPLPMEIGEALVDYLKNGRPISSSRRLFIRHNAPHTAFSSPDAISGIVRAALDRACVNSQTKGAHQFRHALASQMLSNGASLTQIGHLLRHRRPDTTMIYTKFDIANLRLVALPWPEELL